MPHLQAISNALRATPRHHRCMVSQGASNAELVRCIENIVRAGTIAQVDHSAARCRVKSGGLDTDWLPRISLRAGDVRRWSPPSPGQAMRGVLARREHGVGLRAERRLQRRHFRQRGQR
ncbi:phage baseplate assembly protein V [Variovorax paradoxus]|uniref:phage baseplate assembly protein V n=1 Tax=Variovorax paradoxus TaxID=34073 RepID=UPI003D64E502